MAEADKAYEFRPYEQTDIPFLHSSWGNSYFKGLSYNKYLSPEEFFFHHRPIRERFFERPRSTVIVCCSKEDPDLIIGWIAVEKPHISKGLILHYLYVKEAFKGEGIANELIERGLPEGPIMYSHLTERAERIMGMRRHRFKDFKFTPHIC